MNPHFSGIDFCIDFCCTHNCTLNPFRKPKTYVLAEPCKFSPPTLRHTTSTSGEQDEHRDHWSPPILFFQQFTHVRLPNPGHGWWSRTAPQRGRRSTAPRLGRRPAHRLRPARPAGLGQKGRAQRHKTLSDAERARESSVEHPAVCSGPSLQSAARQHCTTK